MSLDIRNATCNSCFRWERLVVEGKSVARKNMPFDVKEWTGVASSGNLLNLARDKSQCVELVAKLHYLEKHYKKKNISSNIRSRQPTTGKP